MTRIRDGDSEMKDPSPSLDLETSDDFGIEMEEFGVDKDDTGASIEAAIA